LHQRFTAKRSGAAAKGRTVPSSPQGQPNPHVHFCCAGAGAFDIMDDAPLPCIRKTFQLLSCQAHPTEKAAHALFHFNKNKATS
jgi:hypothetical protein